MLLPAVCAFTANAGIGKLGISFPTMPVNDCVLSLVGPVGPERLAGWRVTRPLRSGARVGQSTGLRRIQQR
jgi:hypothetical protein